MWPNTVIIYTDKYGVSDVLHIVNIHKKLLYFLLRFLPVFDMLGSFIVLCIIIIRYNNDCIN